MKNRYKELAKVRGRASDLDLEERVIAIRRVAKVVKGGRRFKLSAIVAVGNKDGIVGVGIGKATETQDAIRKATDQAKRHLYKVNINKKGTIPHAVIGKEGASKVLLKPAAPGTGVIANETVRAVLELAGVKNVLTKSLGSNTKVNMAKATLNGLLSLESIDKVAQKRGKSIKDLVETKERE